MPEMRRIPVVRRITVQYVSGSGCRMTSMREDVGLERRKWYAWSGGVVVALV
jgi:hypothetical protein